ncbi:hypothetical protein FDK38_004637 [Candidozyma auris]|nr:hypothetical protein FDK38_004637 [[Candida] auris]
MQWSLREQDVPTEEALASDPYDETRWLEYAEQAPDNDFKEAILSRATATLPASTLLWNAYFEAVFGDRSKLLNAYRKALRVLHSNPSIWTKYLRLLVEEGSREIKSVFDAALFNVSKDYHGDIWKLYLKYASREAPHTAARIYIQFMHMSIELGTDFEINAYDMIDTVLENGDATVIRQLWNDIWHRRIPSSELPRTLAEHCLNKCVHQLGDEQLFNDICDDLNLRYDDLQSEIFTKKGDFHASTDIHRARHFYSQAISHAKTVSQVTKAFDAYVNFEDSNFDTLGEYELENRLDIFENLLRKRPFLINDVRLKSSPNNVDLWLERASIYDNDHGGRIKALVDALMNINPLHSTGQKSLVSIWEEYAKIYLDSGDVNTAILIYSKAAKSQFKDASELASVHIMWTEALLNVSDEAALEHIEDVLYNHIPPNFKQVKFHISSMPVQARVFKSVDLWKFYIDLLKAVLDEKNLEVINNKMHTAYQKMMHLEVITLRLIFDYASFLKQQNMLDRAFSLYEEALRAFQAPMAQYELWKAYLEDTISQKSANENRIRDLLEQCLSGVPMPGHLVKNIFDMYIDFEEKNQMPIKTLKLLERAIASLGQAIQGPVMDYTKQEFNKIVDDKYVFQLQLLTRIAQVKDHQLLRSAYETAVQDLHYSMPQILDLGLRFIEFETLQKEIVRARSLFKHFTSLGSPESLLFAKVWAAWEKFESEHGSEELIQDMFSYRIKLSRAFADIAQAKSEVNPMGFVKGETKGGEIKPKHVENPDAIDLDMDM